MGGVTTGIGFCIYLLTRDYFCFWKKVDDEGRDVRKTKPNKSSVQNYCRFASIYYDLCCTDMTDDTLQCTQDAKHAT